LYIFNHSMSTFLSLNSSPVALATTSLPKCLHGAVRYLQKNPKTPYL
jgi:hypothetical protein